MLYRNNKKILIMLDNKGNSAFRNGYEHLILTTAEKKPPGHRICVYLVSFINQKNYYTWIKETLIKL